MPEESSPAGDDLVRAQQEVLTAAERGDELAFASLAQRIGSIEAAQKLVRERAFVRMAGRGVVARPKLELRDPERDEGDDKGPTMFGHFAVFNEQTEIDSWFEGNFMERIAPGAFKKTFREQSPKVLFQHGQDPFLGDKILGKPSVLREDATGAAYEVPLFRGLPDLLMDGLQAGEYGASFRFRVMREEFNEDPGVSEDNPKGLPERTLKEIQVSEFGPVTFPAYPSATAEVRQDEDADGDGEEDTDAPSTADAGEQEHPPDTGRRLEPATSSTERRVNLDWLNTDEEEQRWTL